MILKSARHFVAGLCLIAAPVSGQNLDDVIVEKAIKSGQQTKFRQSISECRAGLSIKERRSSGGDWRFGLYQVVLSTNIGGISFLAAEAKGLHRPFTILDVPEWIRDPGISLFVDPVKPGRDWGGGIVVPSSIDRVLLRSKADPTSVAESARFETQDVKWDDRTYEWFRGQSYIPPTRVGVAMTGPVVFERGRATATFAIGTVKALAAGDLEIAVITRYGERHCTVGATERLRLFP